MEENLIGEGVVVFQVGEVDSHQTDFCHVYVAL
jgi:hypothetical protein